jgi:hypothetical protein
MTKRQGDELVDITAPKHVEVRVSHNGKTVWVNVNGICLLRACRISHLAVHDDRPDGAHDVLTKEKEQA